ncbi:MAG: LysR substrate-binding domain-containing protein [Janthinobacterium lividum]
MRRLPNFVLLRAFEAAARLESFTRAAEELHLTQSAISHQVKDLETYLGRALFYRRNRRVEPTAEGRRLFDSLGRVFDVIETACSEVALEPRAQVLAVHCAPSFAVKWLGPRLPAFMQAHPDITIRLSSDAEPVDLTRVHEVDVSISYGVALERPGLLVYPLGTERIVPMCSPALLDAAVPLREQITRMTLIDSQLSRVTWSDWFALNGLTLPMRPRPSFDRAAMVLSAAQDGMGVALETTRLAERELARGDLIELGGEAGGAWGGESHSESHSESQGESKSSLKSAAFVPLAREMHFLSYRVNERSQNKIRLFHAWLWTEAGLAPQPV